MQATLELAGQLRLQYCNLTRVLVQQQVCCFRGISWVVDSSNAVCDETNADNV